jgi:GTP-binding protein EngB required for normal cell division
MIGLKSVTITNMQIPDEIRKILETHRRSQYYVDVPSAPPRTLILIGRTRTGKSTISAVLKDSMYVPPPLRLFFGTDRPHEEKVHGLKIIDMPGFFNQNQHDIAVDLSNNAIETMLDHVMRTVGESLTLIAFVFNLENGVNEDDINTMLFIRNKYPGISNHLMLVLTHCEETDAIGRRNLIHKFFIHKKVAQTKLRELFKRGVFFMGCIRPASIERGNSQLILDEYTTVLGLRNNLIEYIYSDLADIIPNGVSHIQSLAEWSCRKKVLCCVICAFIIGLLACLVGFMIVGACYECVCSFCKDANKTRS